MEDFLANPDNKNEAIQMIGRRLLFPIAVMQGLSILTLLASPFLLIWADWSITWKLGLSAIIGIWMTYKLDLFVKSIISKHIDAYIANKKIKT